MADNGRWFKLWCASINDPDLANLDIADFGRWAKFGAYLKEHGTEGSVSLTEPSKMICAMLQLPTLKDVVSCLQKVKNVAVSSETNSHVSYSIKYENWHKYQGDFSTNRVKKFRAKKHGNETPKKRREEKREEENKKRVEEDTPLFISKLKENPAYKGIDIDKELARMDAWFLTPKGKGREKTKAFVVNWLNKIDVAIDTQGGKLADKYKPL